MVYDTKGFWGGNVEVHQIENQLNQLGNLPGVHIGEGAIIGANSVVGNDIDPYTIVIGNPAKVLRKQIDD